MSRRRQAAAPETETPMLDSVRQVFLAALAAMEPKDLADWGKANPNQFFATLLKLIPESELRGADVADVSETPLSEEEWARRARE
ncbi:MAG TPA: hypothetical protein VN805_02495 [Caulobacteraceae bacterium]|nr:hypothetical protein [Caulobacteraceae bacterium]